MWEKFFWEHIIWELLEDNKEARLRTDIDKKVVRGSEIKINIDNDNILDYKRVHKRVQEVK